MTGGPVAVPKSRPQLDVASVRELLRGAGVDVNYPALLGQRGYYRDTMGKPGVNDWGLYDDAIFYFSPTAFSSFNANTDPSRSYPRVAVLEPGLWRYKLGVHGLSRPASKRYKALVQGAAVTVRRVDVAVPDTGWFGINIHRGSYGSTSSEGCQTIHPDQWDGFIGLVDGDMRRHNVLSIPYLLTEQAPA